jgi:hypothetical protein
MLDPSRAHGDGAASGAPVATGGTPSAAGLLLALVAMAGLWLDRAVVHSGVEAAVLAAAVAGGGLALAVLGWRAGRARGARGGGALAAAGLAAFALALAVIQLVVSW